MKRFFSIFISILILIMMTINSRASWITKNVSNNDELFKSYGIDDYDGINKVLNDLKTNFVFEPNINENYYDQFPNASYGYSKIIKGIQFVFPKEKNNPTVILVEVYFKTIVYVVNGADYKKFEFANTGNNINWHNTFSKGAYIDGDFYFKQENSNGYPVMDDLPKSTVENFIYKLNGDKLDLVDRLSYDELRNDTRNVRAEYKTDLSEKIDDAILSQSEYGDSREHFYELNIPGYFSGESLKYLSEHGYFSNEKEFYLYLKKAANNTLSFFEDVDKTEIEKIKHLSVMPSFSSSFSLDDIIKCLAINSFVASDSPYLTEDIKKVAGNIASDISNYGTLKRRDLDFYTDYLYGIKIEPGVYDFNKSTYGIVTRLELSSDIGKVEYNPTDYFGGNLDGLIFTNEKTFRNYAILEGYEASENRFIKHYYALKKVYKDNKYKLFLLFKSENPIEKTDIESVTGEIISENYLGEVDINNFDFNMDVESKIKYIKSILKNNGYKKGEHLTESDRAKLNQILEKTSLKKAFNFDKSTVIFNDEFIEKTNENSKDTRKLLEFFKEIGVDENLSSKNEIQIKLSNEQNKYNFKFCKIPEFDDIRYRFYIDPLDLNFVLSADDIKKFSENNTSFRIEKIEDKIFIIPLSRERSTLPIALKIFLGDKFKDSYINNIPTLYFRNNINGKTTIFLNHYGPLKFEDYNPKNLWDLNLKAEENIALKNVLSTKLLSDEPDGLYLLDPLKKSELNRMVSIFKGKDTPPDEDNSSVTFEEFSNSIKEIFDDDHSFYKFKSDNPNLSEKNVINRKDALILIYRILKLMSSSYDNDEIIDKTDNLQLNYSENPDFKEPSKGEIKRLSNFIYKNDNSIVEIIGENRTLVYIGIGVISILILIVVLLSIRKKK